MDVNTPPKYSKSEMIRALLRLRARLAAQTGQPDYRVLQYRTIEAIAAALPGTPAELREIKGIGDKKLKQFGGLILAAIHGTAGPLPAGQRKAEGSPAGRVLRVGEFLDGINDGFYREYKSVAVAGEIASLSERETGVYLTLKDREDEAVMDCYFPPFDYHRLGFPLAAGQEVKATGAPGIWKPKGRFNFRLETVELIGAGALRQAYELLKARLAAEGLFTRRRPLPEFIADFGVITSRTGAVIHDFRKNLRPLGLRGLLYDVRVEGASAAGEITAALGWFNRCRPDLDVLVIMRGGGSLEDLEAFNSETVARAVFASRIPTIAAIGHERDEPIAGLVADVAVSTPTAAAVLVNDSWSRLGRDLPLVEAGLLAAYGRELARAEAGLGDMAGRLSAGFNLTMAAAKGAFASFGQAAEALRAAIVRAGRLPAEAADAFLRAWPRFYKLTEERLAACAKTLKAYDPANNLKLGYAIARRADGRIIRSVREVRRGEEIENELGDGRIKSKVAAAVLRKETIDNNQ